MDGLENEFQGLLPRMQWSRRGLVMTSLITGFALSMRNRSVRSACR